MEFTTIEAFILALGSLGLGMIMLIRGGNWTIDGSVFIARHFGISPLVVGFTIVAFGTSLPELLVSVNANFHHLPGIAIGNVLGSNIANILLVVGATAMFTVIYAVPKELLRDIVMMLFATLLLVYLMQLDQISHLAGVLMVVILLSYVLWQYLKARQGDIPVEEIEEPEFKTLKASIMFLITGLVFIALGAEFLVRGAKVSAVVIGVPEAVIGLSVIALGTSLPELSTCLVAAKKQQTDLVIGNILGSNVFNILMILGVTASIQPIDMTKVAPQLMSIDIWIVLVVSIIFSLLLLLYQKINRFIGIVFLSAYAIYIIFSLLLLLYQKINRFIGIVFLSAYAIYIFAIYALYLTS
jgi:cation:H+ antiporter